MSQSDYKKKLKRLSFESAKDFLRKRLWFGITLAVLFFLFVFLGLPYYVTSRPSYFGSYKGVRSFRNSWRSSTHAEVDCVRCHLKPNRPDLALFRLEMVGEFYLRAILQPAKPFSWKKPPNEACLVCHSSSRRTSPSGDLLIPHKAHVSVLKMECIDCHEYLVHKKSPEGKHTPRMVRCLKCHNGTRASNECKSCHRKKSYPANHRPKNWLIMHGQKKKEVNCAKCHGWVKDYCGDCHVKRPVSHVARWRAFHGMRVAANRNCSTCHKDSFCIKCHGEIP